MKNSTVSALTFVLFCFSVKAQQASSVEFKYYQGLVFVQIQTAKCDTLLALFDTGAEVSAIDTKTSQKLNLPVIDTTTVTGTDMSMKVEVVALTNLSLGDYFKEQICPTKRDLSHSLSPSNKPLDLILGNDFFANAVVEINFSKKELSIHKNINSKKFNFWIPFSLDHNIPRFSGKVNDSLDLDFRLDTGASLFKTEDLYLNITTRDLNKLKKLFPELQPVSFLSATGINNKSFELPVYRIEKLQVGPLEIKEPYAIVQPEAGYFALPDAVGFLSNNFLSKFDCVAIDYLNNRIYFSDQTGVPKK